MKYAVIYKAVCVVYAEILRPLLCKAVSDPNADWDDVVLDMVDKLFGYPEK